MLMMKKTEMTGETKRYMGGAAFAALCFLLVHLMMIFRFAPFGDEVWDLSGACWGIYLSAGRYTVTLYRMLFSDCGVPVAYGIAASVFFGLAVAVQMEVLNVRSLWSRVVYIAASVGIVQISYLMINAFIADAVCLGVLLASLAFYFYEKWSRERQMKDLLLSVPLGVMALGAYQLLAMLLPCLMLATLLMKRDECPQESVWGLFRKLACCALWCLVILVFNLLAVRVGKMFCSAADLKLVADYQASLITLGQLDVMTHALHIGKQWCMHLVGISYPGEWVYATSLVAVVLLLKDVFLMKTSVAVRVCYAMVVICLYVIPFLPIVAMGEDHGARLFLSQPLACAALWVLALKSRLHKLPSWLVGGLCLFVVLKGIYIVSDTAFYQKRLYEQSLENRAEILTKAWMTPVPSGVDARSCPIVIQGERRAPMHENDRYNSCIPAAGSMFLEQYIGSRYIYSASSGKGKYAAIFSMMPVYPAEGSMRYHEGVILVKLK